MPVTRPGVWGIDLGQCALKAIRLEVIDGEVTATAFDYIEHPKILSQPDADPDQLTREALEKFLSRNNLRGDLVSISVPGQSGLARFVKLPPVEEKKIDDIVKFEAKQQIPFPLDEVVWDYQRLNSGVVTDGFALETEVGLFAMKRDMVNRYLQHFADVKVEVHVVQMAPLALCNFVTYDLLSKVEEKKEEADGEEEDEGDGKKQCVVALDIGSDNSNLVITDGGRIIWQRPIPIGGNHFTRALTKDLKLTFAKAEHLKRNAVKSPDLKKILAALRPVLNDFVSEVQRSLGYFTNTHRDAAVKYMVGLGNAFRLPGLQKFLQEKLQLEVRKLSEFKRVQGESVTTAPQFTENILGFAVAYGLGLQGLSMARLTTNLLPQEIRTERMIRAKKPWAAAAAACLIVGVGFLAFGRARQIAAYDQTRNAPLKKAVEHAQNVAKNASAKQTSYNAALGQAKASQEVVLKIAAGVHERFNWNQLYQYINEALPRPGPTAYLSRLPVRAADGSNPQAVYLGKLGTWARDEHARRVAASMTDVAPGADDTKKDDDVVKKNLIQVHVEGIASLYLDDVPATLKTLKGSKLTEMRGLSARDKALLEKGEGEGMPKAGWLVEVRGYTYHAQADRFIVHTLVENLATFDGIRDPQTKVKTKVKTADGKEEFKVETLGVQFVKDEDLENPEIKGIKLPLNLKKQVADRVKFAFLYTYTVDKNPEPGVFNKISQSFLREAVGGAAQTGLGGGKDAGGMPPGYPGGKDGRPGSPSATPGGPDAGGDKTASPAASARTSWQPLGEVASAAFSRSGSGIPGGPHTPGMPGVRPKDGSFPNPQPPDGNNLPPPPSRPRVPRTEFVIMFVWAEPLPPDAADPASPPAP